MKPYIFEIGALPVNCWIFNELRAGTILANIPCMNTRMALKEKVEELEKSEIRNALKEARWVKSRAARMLGLSERMFNYRLKKYGIRIIKEVIEESGIRGGESTKPDGGL